MIELIPESHRRLGRHVDHDPASWGFQAEQAAALKSVLHNRAAPPFDQGNLGSCTVHAAFGLMVTDPFAVPGRNFSERAIVTAYEWETAHDNVPGIYPPDDTGSSGLAACKTLRHLGLVKSYHHAFGLQAALAALVLKPVITGVNWYEGFDRPTSGGLVHISGQVRGGHEFEIVGVDVQAQLVRACNSWGNAWGDGGYFSFSWSDWDRLLSEQGDVTTVSV